MRSFFVVISSLFLTLGCGGQPQNSPSEGTPADEMIQAEGQVTLHRSAELAPRELAILAEPQVKVELYDHRHGNASDLKIFAHDKSWQTRVGGNKNLATGSFEVSTMAGKEEIKIKGVRTSTLVGTGQNQVTESCEKHTEIQRQCGPPNSTLGSGPCSTRSQTSGRITVTQTVEQHQVTYKIQFSDRSGVFATIETKPQAQSRVIHSERSRCQ